MVFIMAETGMLQAPHCMHKKAVMTRSPNRAAVERVCLLISWGVVIALLSKSVTG